MYARYGPEIHFGVGFPFQRIEVGEKVLNQPHAQSGKFKVLAWSDW